MSDAHAHAMLQKTEPGRRATLSKPPAMVRLWFNEKLEPAFSSITVTDGAGRTVSADAARVAAGNPKLLEVRLPDLAPGEYTVSYEVLSIDGHTVKSKFTFTIKAAAKPQ